MQVWVLWGAMQCMEPTSTHMQLAGTEQHNQVHIKALQGTADIV
jgi:hypothetical protein